MTFVFSVQFREVADPPDHGRPVDACTGLGTVVQKSAVIFFDGVFQYDSAETSGTGDKQLWSVHISYGGSPPVLL